jgi:esterase/lipase superfamily enzyme
VRRAPSARTHPIDMPLMKLLLILASGVLPALAQSFEAIAVRPPASVPMRVLYVTDRKANPRSNDPKNKSLFTAERSPDGSLSYGTCIVTIPREHVIGSLEEPLPGLPEDATKHVMLYSVDPGSDTEFYRLARDAVSYSDRTDTFVFIHGFNTTFQDAARRTAQIAYDLKFEGAAIFYSWPSQGKASRYLVDETNATWTVPHLETFLKELRVRSGAAKVHIIAHSMGARILAQALRDLGSDRPARVRFNQIVLAAADIDRATFIELAGAINGTGDRITLYASSRDRALKLSRGIHGYTRAGESGTAMTIVPGMDTVDATSVYTDFFSDLLSHSYFTGRTVLADLFLLLKYDLPPRSRFAVFPRTIGKSGYWEFHP